MPAGIVINPTFSLVNEVGTKPILKKSKLLSFKTFSAPLVVALNCLLSKYRTRESPNTKICLHPCIKGYIVNVQQISKLVNTNLLSYLSNSIGAK